MSGSELAMQSASHGVTHVRTRRWVRRPYVVHPFVWRGLLPLLGLLALAWFGFGSFAHDIIERRVDQQVRADLDAAGLAWVTSSVSGQEVVLGGDQPQAGAGERALAVARASVCPTWTGPRLCATQVTGQFSGPAAAAAAAAAAPASAALAAAQACERGLAQIVADRRIEFATGRADLLPSSAALLDELAKAAKDCPGTVRVEGHTDAVGRPEANRALSLARAEAVRQALVQRGMKADRLAAEGFGPDRPVGDNATAEGRARNRRIEFRVSLGA